MKNIIIEVSGKSLEFSVKFADDYTTPWEFEGSEFISDWTIRDKKPGELSLLLNRSGDFVRFYNFSEACKVALAEKWDALPYNDGSETPRQQAAKAARSQFEHFRGWCQDEWAYVGVIVTLLDECGNETEISDSVWGVENKNDWHHETAKELAKELADGFGSVYTETTKTTFTRI